MQSEPITTIVVGSRLRARHTTLCDRVCQWLAGGRWFSLGPPVSSTNKTNRHDITEILLKVVLNTIKQKNNKQLGIILLNYEISANQEPLENGKFYIDQWVDGLERVHCVIKLSHIFTLHVHAYQNCVRNAACFSVLFILYCPFSFLSCFSKLSILDCPFSFLCVVLIAPSVFSPVSLCCLNCPFGFLSCFSVLSWLSLRFSLMFLCVVLIVPSVFSPVSLCCLDCPFGFLTGFSVLSWLPLRFSLLFI